MLYYSILDDKSIWEFRYCYSWYWSDSISSRWNSSHWI